MTSIIALAALTLAIGQGFGSQLIISDSANEVRGTTAADFDGDGDMDIVSTIYVSGSSTTVLNENLGGTFGPSTVVSSIPGTPADIFAPDLNGDGLPDLLTFTDVGDLIAWNANLGGNQFAPPVLISTASGPRSIFAADLDGDGDVDILASFMGSLGTAWFQNQGGGTFGPGIPINPSANDSLSVIAVDLDGDGDNDVVSALYGSDQIVWHENLGAGSFGPQQILSDLFPGPRILHAADIDNDGDADLIAHGIKLDITPWGPFVTSQIGTLENLGAGGFGPPLIVAIVETTSIATADLDQDGNEDLVYVNNSGDRLSYQRNLGGGLFDLPVTITPETVGPRTCALFDLDGDGDPDVISTSSKDTKIAWYENQLDGPFVTVQLLDDTVSSIGMATVADLDQDGDQDVLAARRNGSSNEIGLYRNLGGGSFLYENVTADLYFSLHSLAAIDLDGDGDLDVLLGDDQAREAIWYENLGAGQFGPKIVIATFSLGPPFSSLAAVDLDGDGDLDLLTTRYLLDIGWLEGLGGGQFASIKELTQDDRSPSLVGGFDMDADGDMDVVSASNGADELDWYENLGAGLLGPLQMISNQVDRPSDFDAADLDGDGDLEILVTGFNDDTVQWFENLGTGQFGQKQLIHEDFQSASTVGVGDLDGDGDPDAFATASGFEALAWYENVGGAFGQPQILPGGIFGTRSIDAGDLDGDGDLDLVAGFEALVWFKNDTVTDCNGNGVADSIDISTGVSADCNANGYPDECDLLKELADIDGDGQLDECVTPALIADKYQMSVAKGGTQTFILTTPVSQELYLLLGTSSGATPGLTIDGLNLPLNQDSYFLHTLAQPNAAPLSGSFGIMPSTPGGGGQTTGVFTLPAAFSSTLVGLTLHHAFMSVSPVTGAVTFTSNAVPLALVP